MTFLNQEELETLTQEVRNRRIGKGKCTNLCREDLNHLHSFFNHWNRIRSFGFRVDTLVWYHCCYVWEVNSYQAISINWPVEYFICISPAISESLFFYTFEHGILLCLPLFIRHLKISLRQNNFANLFLISFYLKGWIDNWHPILYVESASLPLQSIWSGQLSWRPRLCSRWRRSGPTARPRRCLFQFHPWVET